MKVEVVEISSVEKRVEVEVPVEQVADEIEEKYDEVRKTVPVKGFRPGKAPRKVLERLFKNYVHELVAKSLVEDTLETALDRKGIKPVAAPVLDPSELKPGEVFAYTAHVEVKPQIELKAYKGMEVVHQEVPAGDEHVAKTLQDLRERVAVIKAPDAPRPIKPDDVVVAKISVKEGDKEINEKPTEESEIRLWEQTWVPGLADRLAGKNVGDTVAFTAAVDEAEGTPARFRGKTLDFAFAIADVKERVLAELDDNFAKENSRFTTLAELKTNIKQSLAEIANRANRSRLEQAVLDTLIEKNPAEVPPTPAKHEALQMAREFLHRNGAKNVADEAAERFSGMFLEEAKKSVKAIYLLEAVANAEGLEVSDDEIGLELEREAEAMGTAAEKLKARLGEEGLEGLKQRALIGKALDFLIAAATIKEAGGEAKAADPA